MSGPTTEQRLGALVEAARLLGRFATPELLESVDELCHRAGERERVGLHRTVVALSGSTGSGKSSLFNAIAGLELAETGVRRPTTAEPLACVWAEQVPTDLLDWLAVPNRRRVEHRSTLDDGPEPLDGLVLLDLPDHDSMLREHRAEVDRLVGIVDIVVWVTDPVKYADALLHEEYLSRLSRHGAVVHVVLNHVDRLSQAERQACLTDLRRLLARDGLADMPVLATSAVDGTGVSELRARVGEAVEQRRAATDRLDADVRAIADQLRSQGGLVARPGRRSAAAEHAGLLAGTPDELAVEVERLLDVDTVSQTLRHRHEEYATGELAWPWANVDAYSWDFSPVAFPDTLGTLLNGYVEQSVSTLPPAWHEDVRGELEPVTTGLVHSWRANVQRALATAPEPRDSWQPLRRDQRLVVAAASAAVVSVILAFVLGVAGSGFALVAGLVALLSGAAAGLGYVTVDRRRVEEQASYAEQAGAESAAMLRGQIRRDIRERLEMPLRAQHRDRDAAVAALHVAES